jgi:hypothetical protein
VFGEHQDDDFGVVDRADDLVCVQRTGDDIARGNPAPETVYFQCLNEHISYRRIMRGVAYEDVGLKRLSASRWLLAVIFGHVGPLRYVPQVGRCSHC